MNDLKEEIKGLWSLLSYIEVPINGTNSLFPLGKKPKGFMVFSEGDFMSLQISGENRQNGADDDRFTSNVLQLASSARSYVALSGLYRIHPQLPIVNFKIFTSLFPNWEGKEITRNFTMEGDTLFIKTDQPILSNGVMVNSYMTWERCADINGSAELESLGEKTEQNTALL